MKKLLASFPAILMFSVAFAQETEEVVESVELPPETYTSVNTMVYYYVGGFVIFLILYFIVTKIVKNKQSASLSQEMESIAQLPENEKSALWNELFDAKGMLPRFKGLLSEESIVSVRQCYPYQTL
jgi:flagellar biosynthesis/type III secretory pathway M-ring protein FliF/YscJ